MSDMPDIYDKLDAQFEAMETFEKKFLLYKLLNWHQERLNKIINGTPDPDNAKDAYAMVTMVNHKKIADEMMYILFAELF